MCETLLYFIGSVLFNLQNCHRRTKYTKAFSQKSLDLGSPIYLNFSKIVPGKAFQNEILSYGIK
jgi:hypothetical protein